MYECVLLWLIELSNAQHENSLTIQALKQKMVALRNEHTLQIESMRASRTVSQPSRQAPANDDGGRLQYEAALQKIRGAYSYRGFYECV